MPVTPVCVPSPNVGQHGYVTIVDAQGYVIGTIAASDGATFGSISGESSFVYTSGGPPLLDGSPSQLTFDRARGYLGKSVVPAATISSTSVGDMSLSFSVAPKTIMPGMAMRLNGIGISEYVYVSNTYIPSATATVIPLQSPVVLAGEISAIWETFSAFGPGAQPFMPVGVTMQGLALSGTNMQSLMTAASSADADGGLPQNSVQVVPAGITGTTSVDRLRTPNIFKPFNAQSVTAKASNTPTSIWTPASGKKFRLMGYWFSLSVAAGLVFHDLASVGSGGLMPCPSPLVAAAGIAQCPPIGNGILSATVNNQLWIDATTATTVTGFCWGTEE